MIDKSARQEYQENLVNLINDVRQELKSPLLPVVIGELGNGGPTTNPAMQQIRDAQAAAAQDPRFFGTVGFVPTAQFARPAEDSPNTGHGHHWFGNADSYFSIGDSLGQKMLELMGEVESKRKRVLILGDSISMGYTSVVRQELRDQAIVIRPMRNHKAAENCAGTDRALTEVDRWLRLCGGNWDVIHFNFGLHDLKRVKPDTGKNSNDPDDPYQTPPEEYRVQLEEIVRKLKATEAKLIFATTTPVPKGVRPYRAMTDPMTYNQIAREIMQASSISCNDLFGWAQERLDEIQKPNDVHFSREGSRALGKQVAEAIQEAWN